MFFESHSSQFVLVWARVWHLFSKPNDFNLITPIPSLQVKKKEWDRKFPLWFLHTDDCLFEALETIISLYLSRSISLSRPFRFYRYFQFTNELCCARQHFCKHILIETAFWSFRPIIDLIFRQINTQVFRLKYSNSTVVIHANAPIKQSIGQQIKYSHTDSANSYRQSNMLNSIRW